MRDILSDLEQGPILSDPDPVRRAQILMQTPLPKRFYEHASVADLETGFAVHLDDKSVRTPARQVLLLPSAAAAQIVADEFNAQVKVINPTLMPATRLVNTAIDGIAQDPQAVLEDILRFAANDMMFYRAETPEALVQRQTARWDPLIDWAETLGARFNLDVGVMHIAQPREAIAAFGVHLSAFTHPVALASLHTMTTLTGSAIIALAIAKGHITADEGWSLAHLDEDWTIEQWGEDLEAVVRRANRAKEMFAANALLIALASA